MPPYYWVHPPIIPSEWQLYDSLHGILFDQRGVDEKLVWKGEEGETDRHTRRERRRVSERLSVCKLFLTTNH